MPYAGSSAATFTAPSFVPPSQYARSGYQGYSTNYAAQNFQTAASVPPPSSSSVNLDPAQIAEQKSKADAYLKNQSKAAIESATQQRDHQKALIQSETERAIQLVSSQLQAQRDQAIMQVEQEFLKQKMGIDQEQAQKRAEIEQAALYMSAQAQQVAAAAEMKERLASLQAATRPTAAAPASPTATAMHPGQYGASLAAQAYAAAPSANPFLAMTGFLMPNAASFAPPMVSSSYTPPVTSHYVPSPTYVPGATTSTSTSYAPPVVSHGQSAYAAAPSNVVHAHSSSVAPLA